jgi:hypothetical protein
MADTHLDAEQRIPERQRAEVPAAAAGAHQRTRPAAVVDPVSLLPVVKLASDVAGRGEAGVRVTFLPTDRRRAQPSDRGR